MQRPPHLTLRSLLLIVLSGCGASFSNVTHIVRSGAVSYRVGALPSAWSRIAVGGDRVAFHHRDGGTISTSVTCNGGEDAPLDVLTEHLLFGIEPRVIRERTTTMLDDRGALVSEIDGRLDGVPITLALVVLKKDGCVFDLQLVGGGAQRAIEFHAFWSGFAKGRAR